MGLLSKRMKDPVEGTARVVAVDYPHGYTLQSASHYVRFNFVVSGPGVEPVAVELKCTVRSEKIPLPDTELPVIVDRANAQRIQIPWDKIGTPTPTGKEKREAARKLAEDAAAEMRAPD